jgi:transcriptional regulator with XRE-family HTH domain
MRYLRSGHGLSCSVQTVLMTRRAPRRETPALGDAIRRCREERHLTLEEAARRIGTSQQNLSNWENGRRPRSRAVVDALDVALGADGDIVRAYLGGGELADRVAQLELRMALIETVRDKSLPQVHQNTEDLAQLWDQVRQLADDVQRLIGRAQRTP